jgi:chloramphenicol-sensitive protein RarD
LISQLSDSRRGMVLGVTAYLIWGFGALYWVETEPVDAVDLLAHRALWSLPVVIACLLYSRQLKAAWALLKQPRNMMIMAGAAFCSALNWGIFLWAVTNSSATQASLGYFLLPLLNVLIGLTIFKESIDSAQKLAVFFAIAGIGVQVVYYQGLPMVSLGVAISFGLYGAIRKGISIGSVEGLFIELLLMAPFALGWLIYRDGGGLGVHGSAVDVFLLASGIITAVPLMAYVAASKLLPLSALGLVFYIGPTVQLFVAVWVLGESFTLVSLISFGLVWLGLILMTADNLRRAARHR